MDAIIRDAFFDTVEGNERLDEAAMIDGKLTAQLQNDKFKTTQPNPSLLADVLRSQIELTPEIREWLANLVDPKGAGKHALVFRDRTLDEIGKTLFRKKTELRDYHIGEFVTERMQTLERDGVPKREIRQKAIDAACKEFGVMDTVVTDAVTYWQRMEAALDEDASS